MVRDSAASIRARRGQEEAARRQRQLESREARRQEIDHDTSTHLYAYSALAEEEKRLLQSLEKWSSMYEEAQGQLDGVLSLSNRAASSRPVSRQDVQRYESSGLSPRAPTPAAAGAPEAATPAPSPTLKAGEEATAPAAES